MADRSKDRADKETPSSYRLGVGREANNLTPDKAVLFRNLTEAKNGLIFWSDTGEGKE
jgi:hypothetical protein